MRRTNFIANIKSWRCILRNSNQLFTPCAFCFMALKVYSVNDVFKISSENEKKWVISLISGEIQKSKHRDSKKKIIKKQAFA